ncbi:Os10g0333401 [Oryza sativa Japonica Group]|uniref:Os10g0333401 protein n=1 Tax=Oryza sativa subsp. japonica TaxID=39947 RepID=A0A0P0XT67_ORYSJ|nr:Os10g0333401 [Oryza sativa Japonica Group]
MERGRSYEETIKAQLILLPSSRVVRDEVGMYANDGAGGDEKGSAGIDGVIRAGGADDVGGGVLRSVGAATESSG